METSDIVQVVIRNNGMAGIDRLLGDKDEQRLRPSFVRGLARRFPRCITGNASSITPAANRGAGLPSIFHSILASRRRCLQGPLTGVDG